jgi:hypothetical protein
MAAWTCPGCTRPCSEDDPEAIVRHVSECDYADGAGQPADLHVKFSVVRCYLTAVRSGKLAGVTGGLPFRALRGRAGDRFGDEGTEDTVAGFLDSLAEAAGPGRGRRVRDQRCLRRPPGPAAFPAGQRRRDP